MMVAFWRTLADRGLTTVPGFSDPAARELLDGPFWSFLLARVDRLARKSTGDGTKGFMPWVDSIILRVAFIDAQIAQVNARQVVILGAGLDTRAWRLEALRGARVFEVDHPATQAYKRERAGRLGPPIAAVHYVAMDFGRDHLETTLRAAGYDATLPSVWVWEGVIMYLDDVALRRTLVSIRNLFSPGSRLLAHYHEPEATKRGSAVRKLLFSWLGEPQIGLRTARQMANEVTRAGFTILEDAGLDEQAARVGTTASKIAPLRVSRIVVAI
jgi:methyltransferase (TIGR00027 family)